MSQDFLKHILLVLDATEPSQAAMDMALGLASQTGAEKLIVAFITDMNLLENLRNAQFLIADELDEIVYDFELQGRRIFDKMQEQADALQLKLTPVLCRGRFYQVVLKCISKFHADAVVMGGWKDSEHAQDSASIERQLTLDQVTVPIFIVH